jgi:hypothetical protein|tara:strand:+ start:1337 stop:1918 length:582 start_codon:yes stop_codon:yes gene_type:complete
MNGLLSGLILFSSFAMRTPNDESITKDDYEVSIGFKSKTLYVKRDWERELGQNYIDDEFWFVFEPSGLPLYMKPQYVNKTSRDLKYGKLDTRFKKDWFSIGHTILYSEDKTEQGTSVGISNKKKINDHFDMVTKVDAYYFRDEVLGLDRFDKEANISLNWKLTEKIILNNIVDYNDVKGKQFYKFKVGFEYSL